LLLLLLLLLLCLLLLLLQLLLGLLLLLGRQIATHVIRVHIACVRSSCTHRGQCCVHEIRPLSAECLQ
jgi:hypothetical protein